MEKSCYFCKENISNIDYKNTELLRNFLSGQAKILPPRRTGTCAKHQRLLATAIKRARFMALLPFTKK
jgi:small subunit ribosomal protein S18